MWLGVAYDRISLAISGAPPRALRRVRVSCYPPHWLGTIALMAERIMSFVYVMKVLKANASLDAMLYFVRADSPYQPLVNNVECGWNTRIYL